MTTRHAVLKGDDVVNVIMAEPGFIHPNKGHYLVASETAAIGHKYDGKKFVDPTPKPTKSSLVIYAWRRYKDTLWYPIKAVGVPLIMFDDVQQGFLVRAAQRAERDSAFTIDLAQYRHKDPDLADISDNVRLKAKQIIALNDAVTDFHLAQHRTLVAVLEGIKSGDVTTHEQVDHPPLPIPAWPPRRDDPHPYK